MTERVVCQTLRNRGIWSRRMRKVLHVALGLGMMLCTADITTECRADVGFRDREALLENILNERRRITSAEIELVAISREESESRISYRWHLWFDDRAFRADLFGSNGPSKTSSRDVYVFADQQLIRHTEFGPDVPPVVAIVQDQWDGALADGDRVAHPRWLGMLPAEWENHVYFNVEQFYSEILRRGTFAGDGTKEDDKTILRIVWADESGLKREVVVDAERYVVLEVSETSQSKENRYIARTRCSYPPTPSGVFPDRILFRRVVRGKRVTDLRYEVDVLAVNKPVPAKVFRFDGIGAKPGTVVVKYPGARELVWTGSELRPRFPAAAHHEGTSRGLEQQTSRIPKIVLLANCLVLLALAAYFAWRFIKTGPP